MTIDLRGCRSGSMARTGAAFVGAAMILAAFAGMSGPHAQPAQDQPPVAEYRLDLPSLAEELGQTEQAQPDNQPADNQPDAAPVADGAANREGASDAPARPLEEPAVINRAIEAFPLPMPGQPDPESSLSMPESDGGGADQGEGQGIAEAGASIPSAAILDAARHKRVLLRGLDKITGRIVPIDLPVNIPTSFGSLRITARDCHKTPPEEFPETSAFLEISDVGLIGQADLLTEGQRAVLISEEGAKQVFSGWMFASSPAISGLEHPVYDVWVIDCIANSPDSR